jgi:hypothetical protein
VWSFYDSSGVRRIPIREREDKEEEKESELGDRERERDRDVIRETPLPFSTSNLHALLVMHYDCHT